MKISVFGTDNIEIFNNGMPVAKFSANNDIKVSYKDGTYTIYDSDGSILDEVTGPVTFTCDGGLLGVTGLKRAGKQALYHGALQLVKKRQ